ncbi:hypothetical protein [Streptomyces sp. NBC_01803]|uniref:hypothetical protein n=1 Tax=Streptomyces sp. NBC_01803 TaxID=2975946 RepID=UPI002DDA1B75|nr:hypothetical protein [Streptomyces sp. NBC_01803]WSA45129.1 hypothetical protein OIE51_13485 [Streptomyces sp. NBC_01803]
MTPSTGRRWSIGPLRRFTRNLLLPVNAAGSPLLLKYTRHPAEAREEIRGHRQVSANYRVPTLHAHLRVPGGHLVVYERLPAGRDRGLLLDLLNTEQPTPDLTRYLDDLTSHYRHVILSTARLADPTDIIRKLYWDRAAPGGRLDHYYADTDPLLTVGTDHLPLSQLAGYTLHINGDELHLDWTATLTDLKRHFHSNEPVWAAITQGDPTDVNLAHPLAWLDLDTGGLNSIAGEFANYLWYTTALGGWLVPTYNPAAFADHPATLTRLPANTPELHKARIDIGNRVITVSYTLRLSQPRRLAAATYWHRLVQPVAAELWPDTNLADILRPYVAMRILAVYNLDDLAPADRLVLIIRLAEVMSGDFSAESFFLAPEPACPAS